MLKIWNSDSNYHKTDYEQFNIVIELANYKRLDIVREKLNIELPNSIIAIADLQLYNGNFSGYKEFNTNLSATLYSKFQNVKWFVDDDNEFRATFIYKDGLKHVLYRMWKPSITDTEKENFINSIFNKQPTKRQLNKYTMPIGKYVIEAYNKEA